MSSIIETPVLRTMEPADRSATEAYGRELRAEFRENARNMQAATVFANVAAYLACVEKCRELYREISEVEVALMRGLLPHPKEVA